MKYLASILMLLTLSYPSVDQTKTFIVVSVPQQKLFVINNGKILSEYNVSTAKKGVGNISGSNQTPLGLHVIVKKIGKNVPAGGIIKGGIYTGKIAKIISEKISTNTDLLTTRELVLSGLEPKINKGGNVDSLARGIIIHGTPEEGLLGTPASHGCIRLSNKDIISLFNQIPTNTKVLIENKF